MSSASDSSPTVCPGCKAPLAPGAVLCVACGYNLRTGQKTAGVAGQPAVKKNSAAARKISLDQLRTLARHPKAKWIAGGAAAALVLLGGGAFFFLGGETPPPKAKPAPRAAAAPKTSEPVDGAPFVELGGLDAGNAAGVRHVVVSRDGRYAASLHTSSEIVVWDLAERKELFRKKAAAPDQTVFTFAPDGGALVAIFNRQKAVWTPPAGEQTLTPLATTTGDATPKAITPDGRRFVTLPRGLPKLGVWEVESGQLLREIAAPEALCVALRSDGRQAFVGARTTGYLLDLETGRRTDLAPTSEPLGEIAFAKYAPDEQHLLISSAAGPARWLSLAPGATPKPLAEPAQGVGDAAFVGNRYALAALRDGAGAVLWDLPQGAATWQTEELKVAAVALTADGRVGVLARSEGPLAVIETTEEIRAGAGGPVEGTPSPAPPDAGPAVLVRTLRDHESEVLQLALLPNDRSLTLDKTAGLRLWDVSRGVELQKIDRVAKFAAAPDGRQALVKLASGGLQLWDFTEGKAVRDITASKTAGEWALQISADGRIGLASSAAAPLERIDLTSGVVKNLTLSAPLEKPTAAAFAPNGATLLLGDATGKLAMYDAQTGALLKELSGHFTPVQQIAIAPDSRHAVTIAGGSPQKKPGAPPSAATAREVDLAPRVWDLNAGQQVGQLPAVGKVSSLGFLADGRRGVYFDGALHEFDVATGRSRGDLKLDLPDAPGRLLAISADGRTACVVHALNRPALWRLLADWAPADSATGGAMLHDLAAARDPAALAKIRPLGEVRLNAAATAKDHPAAAQARAAQRRQLAVLKDLDRHLAAQPRTAENLFKLTQWCGRNKLLLEAEECLRAALLADPNRSDARELYAKLGQQLQPLLGAVVPTQPFAAPLTELEDAGEKKSPPEGRAWVSLPWEVVATDGATLRLDDKSVTATSDGGPAEFLGVRAVPSTPIEGMRRGEEVSGELAQLWETMVVRTDKTGARLVKLQNRKRPIAQAGRGKAPTTFKLWPDTSHFEDVYSGPYEAVFEIPASASLSRVQVEGSPPLDLAPADDAPSVESLAVTSTTALPQRLTAIRLLAFAPPEEAVAALDKVLAEGNPQTLDAARLALRRVRREGEMIDAAFTPVMPDADPYLVALAVQQGGLQVNAAQPRGVAVGAQGFAYRPTWAVRAPGDYTARIAFLSAGPPPKFDYRAQWQFSAAEPGLFTFEMLPGGGPAEAIVVDLLRGTKLLERKIVAVSPTAVARARTQIARDEAAAETAPAAAGKPAGFWPAPKPATAINLLTASEAELLHPQRVALTELRQLLQPDEADRIPAALAEIARLEMNDPALHQASATALAKLLGLRAVPLAAQLARQTDPPTSTHAVALLEFYAERNADARKALETLEQ